jgi:hypothetical protein
LRSITAAPELAYAQDLSVSQRIEQIYTNISKNEIVVKIVDSFKTGWKNLNMFNNLPGIRHYNDSVFQTKIGKKHDSMKEYTPYLKQAVRVKQIRDVKKQWDNL